MCIYAQDRHDDIGASDGIGQYYKCAAYNLQRENGWHWVVNNQIEGAHVKLYTGSNGSGSCHSVIDVHNREWTNLTSINSIVLCA